MANRKKVQINVDLTAQAKNFDRIVGQAQNQLKQLSSQLTPRQFEQLNQMLTKIKQNANEIAQVSASGFISKSGFDNAKKKVDGLSISFSRFLSNLKSFDIDPKQFLPDSEEFADLQAKIRKTEQALKNLKSAKDRLLEGKKLSATESEMIEAATKGDKKGVGEAAQRAKASTQAERHSLGTQLGQAAKKFGTTKEDLGDTLTSEIEKSQAKLQSLRSKRQGSTKEGQNLEKEISRLKELLKNWERYLKLREEVQQIDKAEKVYTKKAGQVSDLSKKLDDLYGQSAKMAEPIQQKAQANLQGILDAEENVQRETNNTKEKLNEGQAAFDKLDERAKNMGGLKSYFNSLVSATAIFMRLRQAVLQAFQDFQEIDSELNAISVVTGKSMDELWAGFGNLNKIAQEYGVTTKNVIEVQKLYYQQGRNAVEVTQLTGETLKFAKISGLDFANATDYMTAALNAYNIAAKDASTITDTYAALSAAAAVDSQEVAVAMSKVASMAAAGGSNFQDTSAYLSKVIETTRESAETAGTALKISA